MSTKPGKSSWVAFGLFYLVLLAVVSVLDWFNGVLEMDYWTVQAGLVTVGVGVLAVIGVRWPDLSAARGVLIAFTVGILTIIPAVLMALGRILDLWPQYFPVALGMAAGSFLTFLFLKFTRTNADHDSNEWEIDQFDG
jgi:hypothetical protein